MTIIGVTMFSQDSTDGDDYFTGWFVRQGNRIIVSVQVLNMANTTNDLDTFKLSVQTKAMGEGDNSATTLVSAQTITLTKGTITKVEAGASVDSASQGIKDLVRLRFNVKAKSSGRAWVHSRTLNPSWEGN